MRHGDGQIYVLEDNLRVPSGVSYVLENRDLMKRTFPQVFEGLRVRPVDEYPSQLLETLEAIAPAGVPTKPRGRAADAGHVQLGLLRAQLPGAADGHPAGRRARPGRRGRHGLDAHHARACGGCDVIYRRIDDDFLDPEAFRADSLLGVPGLMEAYRAGNVALANAPGNGVADDKVIYAYVPEMIRYYEGEDPILPNVPTYLCWRDADRQHVLAEPRQAGREGRQRGGGYGMLVGPHSTAAEREAFAAKITANPRNYIAQPTLALSRVPTLVDDHLEGRHVDLRPYILYGEEIHVLPGGLTRVALRKGSLVVNSSQGGGSKDTWVLSPARRSPRMRAESLPLLSRVADSVYWMARYIERAENVARFIGVNLQPAARPAAGAGAPVAAADRHDRRRRGLQGAYRRGDAGAR